MGTPVAIADTARHRLSRKRSSIGDAARQAITVSANAKTIIDAAPSTRLTLCSFPHDTSNARLGVSPAAAVLKGTLVRSLRLSVEGRRPRL